MGSGVAEVGLALLEERGDAFSVLGRLSQPALLDFFGLERLTEALRKEPLDPGLGLAEEAPARPDEETSDLDAAAELRALEGALRDLAPPAGATDAPLARLLARLDEEPTATDLPEDTVLRLVEAKPEAETTPAVSGNISQLPPRVTPSALDVRAVGAG